jgi:tetratricopeptide (TPR) repeat protein
MPQYLWHSLAIMHRLLALMLIAALPMGSATAEEAAVSASGSASVAVQAVPPAQARALEIDKLFGLLHAKDADARAKDVELRIWAAWGRNDSVSLEVLLAQATAAMNNQEYTAAEDILNRLIELDPAYAEAINRRATLHFIARRFDKSLADIERVLELEPRHFGALSGRGMILEAQGKAEKALEAYREALKINPHMSAVKATVQRLEKELPEI